VRVETANGTLIEELCEAVGVATNNVAEYRGLLAALTWGLSHGYRRLHVRSDSELLVRQMRGEYRVKNRSLKILYREALTLVDRFERVSFEHVPRSLNRNADRLANFAMDQAEQSATSDPGLRTPDEVSRQHGLPFEDRPPDSSRQSADFARNTRRLRRP